MTITGGRIESSKTPIHGYSSSSTIIDGGSVISNNTTNQNTYGIYTESSATVTINSGSITTTSSSSSSEAYGIYTKNIVMDGGSIDAIKLSGSGEAKAIALSSSGTANINGGTVSATHAGSSAATSIYAEGTSLQTTTININNATISATNTGTGNAYGTYAGYGSNTTLDGGTITVDSRSGNAQGMHGGWWDSPRLYLKSGTISVHANKTSIGMCGEKTSQNQTSYGRVTISGGSITATSDIGEAYGTQAGSNTITGGVINGKTYGVYSHYTATIGVNDGEISITNPEIIGGEYGLYGGSVNFYDGVLRGNEKSYQDGIFNAIPDATTYHTEASADYAENTWLEDAENYLKVGNTEYNSLQKAYDAITGDSGTIEVIASTSIEAVLPASPADKEITLDLNGHTLNFTQTLTNSGTMHITDSSAEKTGKLHNPNTQATITNNGTLSIDATYISGASTAINNNTGSTLDINNSEIFSPNTAISSTGTSNNYNTINLNGTSKVTSNKIGFSNSYTNTYLKDTSKVSVTGNGSDTISAFYNGTTFLEGGTIEVVQTGSGKAYGINTPSATATINAGSITITSSSSSSEANAVYTKNIVMDGGSIDAIKLSGSGEAKAIALSSSGTANINGGTVSATHAGSSAATSIYAEGTSLQTTTININNATISATNTGTGNAYGTYAGYGSNTTLDGGTITVDSRSGNAQGMHGGWWDSPRLYLKSGTISVHANKTSIGMCGEKTSQNQTSYGRVTISGGSITATSDIGEAYGTQAGSNTITGGVINGKTYGVYSHYTATIGVNDGEISITNPEIIGGEYGLYGGSVNFYDGVLRGEIAGYYNGVVKTIADNSAIHMTTEVIDEVSYDTRYLETEHDVVQIGTTKYTQLKDAVAAAEPGDIIELLEDNHLFYSLTIPAGKELAIQTNGYNIVTGNPITNNGKVKIINNDYISSFPTYNYYASNYFITNNSEATLELENIKINTVKGIDNYGTLKLTNVSITATDIAINNSGNIDASNNIVLTGTNYPIYNNGGNSIIRNATLTGNDIYNNAGILTLSNSSAAKTGSNILDFITNKETLNLDNFQASLTNNGLDITSYTRHGRTIYNTGVLSISNHSTISHTLTAKKYEHASAIYNDADGSVVVSNSDITLDNTTLTYNSNQAYGIYNRSGSVTVESGSIIASNKYSTYGIYTDTGTITIGIAEPTSSDHYGRDTADVSTTNPDIKAIGSTTGIGVKNNSGKVYFYDGKVSGNTSSFAENPTGAEYLYQPCTFTDTTTTPTTQYTILKWMRDGQATCGD